MRNYEIGTSHCNKIWVDNMIQFRSRGFDEVSLYLASNEKSWLVKGNLFLFRTTEEDIQYIFGGGIFYEATTNTTCEDIWNFFQEASGAKSEKELREMQPGNQSEHVTSLAIRYPFFLERSDWIDFDKILSKKLPKVGSQNYLKHFESNHPDVKNIWDAIKGKTKHLDYFKEMESPKHYVERSGKIRLGQGTFRAKVVELFGNECAVTRINAKRLIEAAHIKPFREVLEHDISNGIALRADLHKMLDSGYAKIQKVGDELRFIISDRFWKDHNNHCEIYRDLHEKVIANPSGWNVDEESLEWSSKQCG